MRDDLSDRIAKLSPARRALLDRVRQRTKADSAVKRGIPRRKTAGPCAPSYSQQRLWFLDQLEPDSPLYNVARVLRLEGPLDLDALRRALGEIVARHESIRTVFKGVEGSPLQVIGPSRPVALEEHDVSAFPGSDRDEKVRRLTEEQARRPFDLSRDLMLRATLLRLNPQEHILVLVMHHIASDGWSFGVLVRELTHLYTAFAQAEMPTLPELPVQYADFAEWQRNWLRGEVLENQIRYWKKHLRGSVPVPPLPADYPPPARPAYLASYEDAVVAESVAESLKAFSRRERATLFMTLMAAYQVLLHRLTRQEDVVVGFPILGRQHTEVEGLIGFFVNTLVLRTNFSGGPTFRELLGRVRESATAAYAHQDIPFEKLVEELSPKRELNRNPLFDVMLNFMDRSWEAVECAGLRVCPWDIPDATARFPMTLYVSPEETGLRLRLVYRRERFSQERVACFLQQFQYLLEQIAADPGRSIHSYSLATRQSRTVLPAPSERLGEPPQEPVTTRFASLAKSTPDQVAVRQGNRARTYAELARSMGVIANELRAKGVIPGDVVAVSGARSFGLIAGMVAALRRRAVILPIDGGLPEKRKQVMLQQSGAKTLMYIGDNPPEEEFLQAATDLKLILVDPARGCVSGTSTDDDESLPVAEPSPEDPAYIFFTSGTTGVPKAILGRHKGLSHFLKWQRETFEVGRGDRVAQLTNLSFDPVLRDVFLPLTSGGTLCLPDRNALGPREALSWLERERISVLHVVPSLAQSWLADVPPGVSLRSLRRVFFAGEALTDTLIRRWREAFPEAGEIVNLYGPTEATMVKFFYRVPAEPLPGVQPAGRPLPQSEGLVLTESKQLCGIGEPGEIVLRTPFRTLGYLNAAQETAKRFARNPFSDDEQDLLYYTGDLGRYRPDGTLEVLGRLDDQVKVNGVRVEPGEVAATVAGHPSVKSCFVAARKDQQDETYLAAYVVASKEAQATAEDLRLYLRKHLPTAMCPRAFVFLDRLPLTSRGKVDRKALPAPEPFEAGNKTAFVAPRSPLEELIANRWREVLGIEKLGIHDDFFDLGGHSLLATRILSGLSSALEVEIPLRRFFEAPTVAGLALTVTQSQRDENTREELDLPRDLDREGQEHTALAPQPTNGASATGGIAVSRLSVGKEGPSRDKAADVLFKARHAGSARKRAIPRRSEPGPCPLSFAQERLWFLDQFEPNSSQYNIPKAFHLRGPLDQNAVEQALSAIVARHEALRTTFHSVDGTPLQVIAEKAKLRLRVVDLTANHHGDGQQEAQHLLREEAQRPFDLTRDLMLRATLYQLGRIEHILQLVMHHVASDGWSLGILFREFEQLYNACANGASPSLPELPIQYADYARWQRQWLRGKILDQQLGYWKEQLAGLSVLELPIDHPRPAVQSYRGSLERLAFSEELSERLRHLARRERASLFMTLLAAFQALLHRYTGQMDIAVGTPIANRTRVETEGLIGFFANTLVMRADLSDDPSFRELLARGREVGLDAYAHQDLPFEKLVEVLQPERSLSHSPLFQAMFILQHTPPDDLVLPGLEAHRIRLATDTAKFDLTLSVLERGGRIKATFAYNSDLFERETMRRMLNHYQKLLEAVIQNPDQEISQAPILTEPERRQLFVEWNGTGKNYPDAAVHELFEGQVERTPDACAVVFEGRELSYRELNRKADQVARHLRGLGVGPEVLVGICVERSLEMVIGLLGILKTGGAYVPLDPSYPIERLEFMLRDSGAPVLVTQTELTRELPRHVLEPIKVVCVDTLPANASANDDENPVTEVALDNLAYVIYTSGSTGGPKGVAIPHRALGNLLEAMRDETGIGGHDTLLAVTTLSFDIAALELYLPLIVGARLVVASRAVAADAGRLCGLVDRSGATFMQATPATWEMLVAAGWQAVGLKILTGGEALSRGLANSLLERCDTVWNVYGPTETTIWSTICKVEAGGHAVPIGRPIANTQIYILDGRQQPVPVGVPGELHIGGAGLARGYLNRPDLTAEKFIPNPLSGDPRERVYKTGDLVRYLPDGNIEFFGRLDFQVKIRGFRIELGEIEAGLAAHAGVKTSVVVVREDEPGDQRLVAYVVPRPGQTPASEELRGLLKGKLPEYMLPSRFVFLEALPLTPNGKVDRRVLPVPQAEESGSRVGFERPRTPVEVLLAEVWQEVLGVAQVGAADNFFELGGHSLLSMKAVARVERKAGFRVSPREMMVRTLGQIASTYEPEAHLSSAPNESEEQGPAEPPRPKLIPSRKTTGPCALSFAQEALWFLDQLYPGNSAFNLSKTFHLRGPLDQDALQQALDALAGRHEALRTTFQNVDGSPVQMVAPERGVEIEIVDLADSHVGVRSEKVRSRAVEAARRPFDLARDLMLRATLFRLGPDEHILVLAMHHIAFDGWSFGVLFRELSTMYDSYRQRATPLLPELPIQYADYSEWQREWMRGEALEKRLGYWERQLADSKTLELPTDHPRPPVSTFRGARKRVALPPDLCESLRQLGQGERVSMFMVLMAAFQALLHRYSGQADIAVGSPVANRTLVETEDLIGYFVNTLVLRTDFSDDPTFGELLARVREVSLDAYAHQDLPLDKVAEALRPERSLSHSPLFQVMFMLQNAHSETLALSGVTVHALNLDGGTALFDLTLSLKERDSRIEGVLIYNTDLFEAATIQRMLAHYQRILEEMVRDPGLRVSQISIVSESEQRKLLAEWNSTGTEYPNACIHELFEAQVERTPDAPAVVFEDQQLTYRELNQRANDLAHHLRRLGVGPDVLVGICLERSLEMVVGLLGTLKAGGAYVPLDSSYPQARLDFMLEDAGVKLLLTQTDLIDRPDRHGARVVCLDTFSPHHSGSVETRVPAAGRDNLAYVIYTSGSTGRPKGTLIPHRALVNHALAVAKQFGLQPSDRILQFASLGFDAAAEELFPPLLSGATVVLRPGGLPASIADFVRFVADNQLSVLDLPTSYWHEWVSELSDPDTQVPTGVRLVIVGGEKALADRLSEWQSAVNGRVRWMNTYGPTEATITSTAYEVEPGAEFQTGGGVPIGRPIANVQAYVLDRRLQPVPIGLPGELHLGGEGLARGYLNRPDLTAQRFIPNPFSTEPGARLYKTGDLVRYLPDGNLEFLGRMDEQVKVRGFRIELGEVEAALAEHESVKTAVVAAREERPGEHRLLAYVVSDNRRAPTGEELRAFLREKLPDYMLPSRVLFLEAMPMTPNGKVDRRALPAPGSVSSEQRPSGRGPQTPTETLLAEIWRELLGLEHVGVDDNFFDLGGHSLLSMKVIARLERAMGVRVKPKDVMFQTLREIASQCDQTEDPQEGPESVGGMKKLSRTILESVFRREE